MFNILNEYSALSECADPVYRIACRDHSITDDEKRRLLIFVAAIAQTPKTCVCRMLASDKIDSYISSRAMSTPEGERFKIQYIDTLCITCQAEKLLTSLDF